VKTEKTTDGVFPLITNLDAKTHPAKAGRASHPPCSTLSGSFDALKDTKSQWAMTPWSFLLNSPKPRKK